MPIEEARRVIGIYRDSNWKISHLWREAQNMIHQLANGQSMRIGEPKLIHSVGDMSAVALPSGLHMRYEDLRGEQGEKGIEYSYKTRRGRTRIYGGKCIENVCQAIARCIIGEQMLDIRKSNPQWLPVLTVHDSVVVCVPRVDVEEATRYIEKCMRATPEWAKDLPLNCESGVGPSYGDCE